MSDVFSFSQGHLPLLISVPHDGRAIPAQIRARMTEAGRAIPDTDWDIAVLYEFAPELGAAVLTANYSRYVVDLNRSEDDGVLYPGQTVTGLCPATTFSGAAIYAAGEVSGEETAQRVANYWRPYHEKLAGVLAAMHAEHGYALLWDAHSIPSVVPRLFDGELPVLNLGSNDGKSCSRAMACAVENIARSSGYSSAVNARFKGGYITRHYGDPANGIHALQLEIAQRAYMDEEKTMLDGQKADVLRDTLRPMLRAFLETAQQ